MGCVAGLTGPQAAYRRNALVTGGVSGIGFAVARSLVADGYRVALIDKDVERGPHAAAALGCPDSSLFVHCDVAVPDEARRSVGRVSETWGDLHLLVNSAGILGPEGLLTVADQELERIVAVNLGGAIFMSKYAIERMTRSGGGVIVNIASITALTGSSASPAYAAAKAGIVTLTKSLARKYARHNIRTNCVCPGSVIGTNLTKASRGEDVSAHERLSLIRQLPTGTPLRPEDVAELIVFMASGRCSRMNGATVVLDGGEVLGL